MTKFVFSVVKAGDKVVVVVSNHLVSFGTLTFNSAEWENFRTLLGTGAVGATASGISVELIEG